MEQIISELIYETSGEGFLDITSDINNWIASKRIEKGILIISTKHTSCSLTINENADPRVLKDLSAYMKAIVPEGGYLSISRKGAEQKYLHADEGIDDMPAHIRTMLTCSNLSLSIDSQKLVLGTWQAVYLWEHRYHHNSRKLNFHSICDVL